MWTQVLRCIQRFATLTATVGKLHPAFIHVKSSSYFQILFLEGRDIPLEHREGRGTFSSHELFNIPTQNSPRRQFALLVHPSKKRPRTYMKPKNRKYIKMQKIQNCLFGFEATGTLVQNIKLIKNNLKCCKNENSKWVYMLNRKVPLSWQLCRFIFVFNLIIQYCNVASNSCVTNTRKNKLLLVPKYCFIVFCYALSSLLYLKWQCHEIFFAFFKFH